MHQYRLDRVPGQRKVNLSHRVTQELGRAIVRGDYGPGASFPTEAELCIKFGVSRTAIREAVKMLSAKGIVSSKPRQGIRILPQEAWNIFDSDLLQWSLEGNPSLTVLKEFQQMRIAIEPEAAALAAKYARPERKEAIGAALERMGAAPPRSEVARNADIDFHIAILYASENRFYIRMRDFVRTALNVSIRHTSAMVRSYDRVIEDHTKVFHAIRSGNAERARNTMFQLIDEALGFIETEIAKRS
jgi:DNA-binding FadR family transcriptional regulator